MRQAERGTPQMTQVGPPYWTDSIRRDAQPNITDYPSPDQEGYNDSTIQRQMALHLEKHLLPGTV